MGAAAGRLGGQGAQVGFGGSEGSLVLGAHGGVEQPPVAQAHLGRDVPEQRHQALQGHTGVDQCGGVGVAQLVGGGVWKAGVAGDTGNDLAQLVDGHASAVVGEEEFGGSCGAWVRQGPTR